MKLYLTRHGDAEAAYPNPERPLSKLGLQQVARIGAQLNQRGIVIESIYHSGILRARQTAELLAPEVKAQHVAQLSGLRPEDGVEPMTAAIATWTQATMLVGHLPYMDYLLAALTQSEPTVIFATATVVCLAPRGENWKVEWVLNA